ncbi:MAG TPA: TadE/TadG family type IV pilus assembly protein [Chloroflexota bacterium]|nr:TadE/TadG family type IV pilus assembly protein [Chloroflexota bacterium]
MITTKIAANARAKLAGRPVARPRGGSSPLTRQVRSESGQALVEMALVVLIMLSLMGGLFEFGRAFYAYITVIDAAREGARWAMSSQTTDGAITTRVEERAAPFILTRVDIDANTPSAGRISISPVHEFTPILPIDSAWGGGPLEISYTAVSQRN